VLKEIIKDNKLEVLLFVIMAIPAAIYALSIGPIICHDTIAYYKMRVNLLPIYPVFYRGMVTVFGKETGNHLIQLIYLIFTLPIIHWFAFQLKKYFQVNTLIQILILAALYIPIYAEKEMLIMNNLGTEGFSLGVYLLIIVSFYKGFILREKRNVILTLLWVMVMCLLRGQFKFLFPLLLIYELIYQLKNRRFKLLYLFVLVIVPLFTNLIDATYHKILHNKFVTSPFTFITLNSIPMFVSDAEDVNLIEDEYTKDFYSYLHNRLDDKNMLYSKYKGQSIDSIYKVYYRNMPVICNQTIHEEGNKYLWKVKGEDGDWSWVYNERLNKKLMPILIKDNFDKWFRLCWRNFLECFRGWLGMFIAVGLFIWLSMKLFFVRWNNKKAFLWFLLAIVMANALTVTIAIHAIERFFFYNYWLVFFTIFMLFKHFKSKWNYL